MTHFYLNSLFHLFVELILGFVLSFSFETKLLVVVIFLTLRNFHLNQLDLKKEERSFLRLPNYGKTEQRISAVFFLSLKMNSFLNVLKMFSNKILLDICIKNFQWVFRLHLYLL